MDASNVNIDLIRSHVDTIILRSLCDEDKYGYEILNEIKEKSKGLYMLKQPTLYSCLKRLEKLGYIRSYKGDVSNGAQRVYYSLQPEGRAFLESDQVQWEFSRTIIDNLLSDKEFDPESIPPFDPSAYRPMTKRQRNPHSYAEYLASLDETDDVAQDYAPSPEPEEVRQPSPLPEEQPPAVEEEASAPSPAAEEPESPVPQQSASSYSSILDIFRPRPAEPPIEEAPIAESRPEPVPAREPEPVPVRETRQQPVFDMRNEEAGVNYITSFDSIYSAPKNDVREYAGSVDRGRYDSGADQFGFVSLNELRARYAADGYIIRPYIKKNTSEFYINNYYYSNKLLRDCSLFAYALFAVEVLIAYFATFRMTTPSTSVGYLFLFLGIGLLFPVFGLVNWLVDPLKRLKANFSLRSSLINSLIFMLNALILIICLGFFVFGAQIDSPITSVKPIIIPILFLLDIPATLLIYNVLYRSQRYHVS